jgi:prevent-host-death family protein
MNIASSSLKARLGYYLRLVRRGRSLIITDRDEPIARLSPLEAEREENAADFVPVRAKDPNSLPLGKIAIRPVKAKGPSSLELLQQDRRR